MSAWWRVTLLSASLSACGGSLTSGLEREELKGAQAPTHAARAPVRSERPCPVTPSHAQLMELSAQLELTSTSVRRRPEHAARWETPSLNAALTPRAGLIWWSALAPATGARSLPPTPELAELSDYERCVERSEWRAEGDSLLLDVWVTLRRRETEEGASPVPSSAPHSSARRGPRLINLITACGACPQLDVRRALGSPLTVTGAQSARLQAHVPLSEGEAWVAARLRPRGARLSELRSQTCLCR